ncbi:MAG: SPFH domain-containing protein [Campylobacterales bacterium]|nr:SPFH domain-containing protein [Campylobacterales bacterium]NQY54550.1 flotillin family protein [Campylobacteraceae bacterium]
MNIDLISMAFIIPLVIIVALITLGLVFARLYKRATKEISFVRTGMGGEKVIMNGGAIVLPVLHETINVNMNTLRLEVKRSNEQALITKDRMRVDVLAEFYIRVKPLNESIAFAAQTLGSRTTQPALLKELIEGKFVDALRAVAAEMKMVALHEQRIDFVQKVQQVVSEDLLKNGLELESVSLTGLDQTNKKYFNPDNAFDAEGLTRLTEEIEARRKLRNDIERDTAVEIEKKNLETKKISLELKKEEEYATLSQEREISIRKASQLADIAKEEAEQKQIAENSQIISNQAIEAKRISSDKELEEARISKNQILEEKNIEKDRAIELSKQDSDIAISEKSEKQSIAQAQADEARANAVKAEELVITTRDTEVANRNKLIELIQARQEAEKVAITIKVGAEAEKQAAEDQADAQRILAQGLADKEIITAKSHSEAEMLKAEAKAVEYKVEAEGKLSINNASNILSEEQIKMQIKLKLIDQLPEIIAQSVKPMEQIDSIKILQVDGFANGNVSDRTTSSNNASESLPDQLVSSALKYRAQSPIVDSLLKELNLDGASLSGFTDMLNKENK